MKRLVEKKIRRKRRKQHIRKIVKGTPERPRMSVFRSNRHLYVQVIDDRSGTTLLSASTRAGDTKGMRPRVEDGEKLGKAIGTAMKKKKIAEAVFDRNGYLYHGVVKAIADGAREAGIKF
jgi:large subunit ribosomal protein L18